MKRQSRENTLLSETASPRPGETNHVTRLLDRHFRPNHPNKAVNILYSRLASKIFCISCLLSPRECAEGIFFLYIMNDCFQIASWSLVYPRLVWAAASASAASPDTKMMPFSTTLISKCGQSFPASGLDYMVFCANKLQKSEKNIRLLQVFYPNRGDISTAYFAFD